MALKSERYGFNWELVAAVLFLTTFWLGVYRLIGWFATL